MPGPAHRVLHVLTDPKFLSDLARFDTPRFENRVIAVGGREPGAVHWPEAALDRYRLEHVPYDRAGVARIVDEARRHDLVVMHDLDEIKCRAVVAMDTDVSIAWRLYGYEIYSRRPEGLFTRRTMEFPLEEVIDGRRRSPFSGLAAAVGHLRRWHDLDPVPFAAAVRRVDWLLGVVPDEYAELERRWGPLPEFLQFPIGWRMDIGGPDEGPKDLVLVGNGRSMHNNHLDILDAVLGARADTGLTFMVPFSYGPDGDYARAVRRTAAAHPAIRVLDEFLPQDEYARLFERATAAVYNSRRQLGLWNIFACVKHGAKVYLPDSNPVFRWLRTHGIEVFDVARFAGDLASGDLRLEGQVAESNRAALVRLAEEWSYERFQQALADRLAGREKRAREREA